MSYFSKGIAKTQVKRDHRARLLASVRAGTCEFWNGMTKVEAIAILTQDVADFDEILARFQDHRKP